jgi:hypothetical protein
MVPGENMDDEARVSKARAKRCVTHSFACDCREYRFAKMAMALRIIHTWATCDESSPDSRSEAMGDIAKKCKEGLED